MKQKQKNLNRLLIKDFAKKIICDGYLFVTYNSKVFCVMKPGIFIDPEFIKKYAIKNQVFEFESVVSDEVKEKFKLLFRELKNENLEKPIREKCAEIFRYFFDAFSGKYHFLTFAQACYEEFCAVPLDYQNKLHEIDLYLFRKGLYSSAFSIIVAMANDFYHYPMLQDFYNLTFSLDLGLCEQNYSYHVAVACNHENQKPGYGLKYLDSEKVTKLEIDVFLNHPEKSYEFVKNRSYLNYPELAEAILYQHELSDGTGFPRRIFKGQVSNWEAVTILADSLVEIADRFEFEMNAVEYLKKFKNSKMIDIPISRVYKKLKIAIKDIFSQDGVAS
jgi:hypothetical protein